MHCDGVMILIEAEQTILQQKRIQKSNLGEINQMRFKCACKM